MGFPPRDRSGWNRDERRFSPPRQSSAAVACRAMVMATCLVGLLGAALYRTALPDLARELLAGHWPDDTESAGKLAPEAPPFTPSPPDSWQSWQDEGSANAASWPEGPHQGTPVAARGLAPPDASYGHEPDVQSTPSGFAPAPPNTVGPAGAVQASYESPAGQPLAGTAPYQAHPDAVAAVPNGQLTRDRFEPDQQSHPAPNSQPPQMVDRFTYIQTRLRELGATYYLLESWGAQGQYFRFHCRMAVGGSQGYTRHFEATESDALQAMSRVLEEVESWRATP